MLLTYFLNYFDMVPVAPIITGITFVFTFQMRCISIVRSLCFRIFSASFLITFLSPEIATSINILVSLSIFLSSILQLIIPKLYLNTGTASAPISVILFLAFSSDFSYYYYYYYYYYLFDTLASVYCYLLSMFLYSFYLIYLLIIIKYYYRLEVFSTCS